MVGAPLGREGAALPAATENGLDVIVRFHAIARLPELQRCLLSLIGQTYRPLTVHIVTQRFQPAMMDKSQAVLMTWVMPVFFTAMMMNYPAGLSLYIFTNNLLSILQQFLLRKYLEKKGIAAPRTPPAAGGGGGGKGKLKESAS